MGCGQSSHFNDAGEGQTLGGSTNNNKKTTTNKTSKKSYNTMASTSTSSTSNNPRSSTNNKSTAGEVERRAMMLNAAEERAKAGVKRGIPNEGKLAKQLAATPADGGRREEAIQSGSGKNQAPLVWD